MSTTYAWNVYTKACPERVWDAISAVLQDLAAEPLGRTAADSRRLLVIHEVAAIGHARELGFTVAADSRQDPCEVDWRVREIDGGAVVTLTVIDPEDGWDAEAEQGWLPLLDRLGALLREPATLSTIEA
jgi:hypothetical protein